jgi:hypothetical protein
MDDTTELGGLPPIYSISAFTKPNVSPFGRSKTYTLIAEGKLETVRVGGRQYIVTASYLKLINEGRTTGAGIVPEMKPGPKRKVAPASSDGAV